MLFTSPLFLFAFLPAVLAVYFAVPRRFRGVRNAWLLAASLVFYGAGEPGFVAVLAASCLVNWAAGLLAAPGRPGRRAALWAAVAANLALLFRWKYLAFAVRQLDLLPGVDLPVPDVALPLGISFFTFQAMSYVIDVHRGVSRPQRNPLDVALYVTLFPQLVAGPIVRYETVAEEIRGRRENWADFSGGVCRFAEGFAKKMLLANPLGVVADSAFDGADWIPAVAGGGPASASMAWLGDIVVPRFPTDFVFDAPRVHHRTEGPFSEAFLHGIDRPRGLYRASQYDDYLASQQPFSRIENRDGGNGKTLCVVKDSFASVMLPNLAVHFRKIVTLDPRNDPRVSLFRTVREEGADAVLFVLNPNSLVRRHGFFGKSFLRPEPPPGE